MNSQRINECMSLAEEILKNFELSEMPVGNILLKCLRLYRLLGDEEGMELFLYETSGYPTSPDGISSDIWTIGGIVGRHYQGKNSDGKTVTFMNRSTLSELSALIETNKERLKIAGDPQSYGDNATPLAIDKAKNVNERNAIVKEITNLTNSYQTIFGHLYSYVLRTYQALKYGNTVDDIFTEARLQVDERLSQLCPEAIAKFVSVYENMDSSNPEDWANAVHSCRRILKDFADSIYPPTDIPVILPSGKTIKVGEDNVINRLIQYVENNASSKTYSSVVGSTLQYLGNRLDAIFEATNKGTHSEILQGEAKRYIFYTYMCISDIVSLMENDKQL